MVRAEEQAVLAEIRRLLAGELDFAGAVRPDDDLFRDLQLDSVGLLTLVVGLEDRFRVALGEEDAARVRTVRDLAALVTARATRGDQERNYDYDREREHDRDRDRDHDRERDPDADRERELAPADPRKGR